MWNFVLVRLEMMLVMRLEVVPDLLVSVGKLDLWWIRRWLSDYNDHKVAAP
jgi:hypothetical protein